MACTNVPTCEVLCASADLARSHLRNKHKNVLGGLCQTEVKHTLTQNCKFVLSNKKNLESHLRVAHGLGKCMKCPEVMLIAEKDKHMADKHGVQQCRCTSRAVTLPLNHTRTSKCGSFYKK